MRGRKPKDSAPVAGGVLSGAAVAAAMSQVQASGEGPTHVNPGVWTDNAGRNGPAIDWSPRSGWHRFTFPCSSGVAGSAVQFNSSVSHKPRFTRPAFFYPRCPRLAGYTASTLGHRTRP